MEGGRNRRGDPVGRPVDGQQHRISGQIHHQGREGQRGAGTLSYNLSQAGTKQDADKCR